MIKFQSGPSFPGGRERWQSVIREVWCPQGFRRWLQSMANKQPNCNSFLSCHPVNFKEKRSLRSYIQQRDTSASLFSLDIQLKWFYDKYLSREWVRAHTTSPASLQGWGLQRDHDSRFHFLNEWDCVVHQFLPAVFMPGSIPYVFPGLKVLVSPEVMHHI